MVQDIGCIIEITKRRDALRTFLLIFREAPVPEWRHISGLENATESLNQGLEDLTEPSPERVRIRLEMTELSGKLADAVIVAERGDSDPAAFTILDMLSSRLAYLRSMLADA